MGRQAFVSRTPNRRRDRKNPVLVAKKSSCQAHICRSRRNLVADRHGSGSRCTYPGAAHLDVTHSGLPGRSRSRIDWDPHAFCGSQVVAAKRAIFLDPSLPRPQPYKLPTRVLKTQIAVPNSARPGRRGTQICELVPRRGNGREERTSDELRREVLGLRAFSLNA